MLSTFSGGLEKQMEFESRVIADRAESADGREGVDAFTAKRKPEFAESDDDEAAVRRVEESDTLT